MLATVVEAGPVAAEESDLAALAELNRLLKERQADEVRLVGPAGEPIALPEAAFRALRQVVDALARDRVIIITPLPKLLSIDQAADLLNVRATYLSQLLDQDAIPTVTVHGRPRISFGDLMAYKEQRDARRRAASAEIKRISEELGLYDEE